MTEKKKQSSIDRRKFLGLAWTGSLTLLFGQFVVATLNYIQPISKGGFGGLVYAGKVEEFLVDSVNRIMAGRFYLSRSGDGVIALWQKCTHLGCAVPWVEEEGQFHCPCHGSLFNRQGEVTGGPAPRPMDMFPVTVKNDELWVDTSKPIERAEFDPSQLTQL